MKSCHLIFLLLILFIFSCEIRQEPTTKTTSETSTIATNCDDYFTALTDLKKFNGVVLVHKDGKEIFKKVYNIHDDPKSKFRVSTDHQFDLRSLSKLMAKTVIIKLEAEGKLNRSDVIEKYVSGFPSGDKITLQHLMDNASGFAREFIDEENMNLIEMSTEEVIELIKTQPLEFEPGTDTRYSNLGFQILYYIIGEMHNKSFAEYMIEDFFEPLGMNHSGAHFFNDKNKLKKFAYYHELDDGEIVQVDHFEKDSKPQARLFSTADDLMLFLKFLNQEPYLSAFSKKNSIGHAGGSDGIRTYISTHPKKNYSYVFLANYDEIPLTETIRDIENIIEGRPFEIPKPINRKSVPIAKEVLEKYVGKYDMEEINHIEFEFKIEKDSLAYYQDGEFSGRLFSENDSTFFDDPKLIDGFTFKKVNEQEYELLFKWLGAEFIGVKK